MNEHLQNSEKILKKKKERHLIIFTQKNEEKINSKRRPHLLVVDICNAQ